MSDQTRTPFLPLAALLCLSLAGCDKGEDEPGLPDASGEQAPAREAIEVPGGEAMTTGAVQRGSHRWVGSVKAKHHVELAPGMTGVISSIEVEEGDQVEKGQRLFRVEGSEVKLAVAQTKAAVASAELQVAEAEREAERTRKLAKRGSVGAANLERAESGVEAAKAGLKQAKAAVAVARARTADLSVESPIDGVVTSKLKSVGEVATMMPPTVVLIIDDLSTVEVRVRVPELKLREIDVGSPVSVYFPALDEEREVPITRIGNAVDPRTRTIELIIEVDNADLRIKSGMSVEVGIGAKAKAKADDDADASEGEAEGGDEAEQPGPTAMVDKPEQARAKAN